MQPNARYRWVLTAQLNHLASLANWLNLCLRTKWLWVRMTLLSLKLPIWHQLQARISLTFRQNIKFRFTLTLVCDIRETIECRFTLKLARNIIITCSQMHIWDKYSQDSSIIWPVWLNGWVFIYKLSGCWLESRCCL